MNVIQPQSPYIKLILDEPELQVIDYTQSIFNFIVGYDDSFLLHNTFTKEVLVLDKHEYVNYINIDINTDIVRYLIKNRFLVPNGTDEIKIFNQLCKMVDVIEKKDYINCFNILTTTDCNARCFYCFEAGINKQFMTEHIAKDVIDYIQKVSKGHKVDIRWFGGEPLFNMNVIDIIANGLKDRNIQFSSYITTNGYLFNKLDISKIKTNWNLRYVQITIDGTEKIYNRTKNYIYKSDESPYQTVLKNVFNLLSNNISVNIQINLNKKNHTNTFDLVDELYERFSKFKNLKICPSYVVDKNNANSAYDDEQFDYYLKLQDYVLQKGLAVPYQMNLYINGNKCFANKSNTAMILPDGKLAKCDMLYDKTVFGSVYSNEIDKNILENCNISHEMGEYCRECIDLPNCTFLKNCPLTGGKPCNKIQRDWRYRYLKQSITELYEKYLAKN